MRFRFCGAAGSFKNKVFVVEEGLAFWVYISPPSFAKCLLSLGCWAGEGYNDVAAMSW